MGKKIEETEVVTDENGDVVEVLGTDVEIDDQKPDPDKKEIRRVVTGKVRRKPKSAGRKLEEAFIQEKPESVGSYLLWDVLIPAIKDTVSEMIKRGIDAILYGNNKPSNVVRKNGRSYTRYDKASYEEPRGRRGSLNRRAVNRFDDLIFDSRVEAEEILSEMVSLLDEYDIVTVADFYEIVGEESNYMDNDYGWYDLRRATVEHTRDGFVLNLPKARRIDG